MITLVIFDLDDTLYDEIEYCRSGFAAVSEFLANTRDAHDRESIFSALWGQFTAGNHTRTFNAALDELAMACDDKHVLELVKVYRNHVPKITLPEESRSILIELSSKYALGLLTDGFLPAQRLKVQQLGIEGYFQSIVYTEELGREFWKPSPAGFEKIMRDLNTRAENSVYIADNEEKDFIAPNRLGLSTVQLLRPARIHTSASHEPGAAAQHKTHQISQIPAIIERL
ncbi:MAG: HAD family hydrolase [Planctomycetota bacterium]|jgi:putative hydrolase of the HAD superfamily